MDTILKDPELLATMYASYMVEPSYTREDFRTLLIYVRRMKHKYATFTVLTPLPGTDLYTEYTNLWARAIPLYRVPPTLARFGIHGMLKRIRALQRVPGKG